MYKVKFPLMVIIQNSHLPVTQLLFIFPNYIQIMRINFNSSLAYIFNQSNAILHKVTTPALFILIGSPE